MAELIRNDPPRPLFHRFFYRSTQWLTLVVFKFVLRLQARYLDRLPTSGGALICPNHLSNLDPMVIGCVAPRRVNFLAKKTLLDPLILGWILRRLDCIPIDREASGIGGMKETLKRLKKGESVILFPEGERSYTGELMPLMNGFTALVRRVKIPMVPVGIHGTFEAWPRGTATPWFGRVKVVVGEPIEFAEVESLNDQEMSDLLAERLAACFDEAQQWNLGREES